MADTASRLLQFLSLLQSGRTLSSAELAEALGASQRTVRRDVERLRAMGYHIEASAGTPGYRLGAGASVPPLVLDDEEALAVAIGLRAAAFGSVAGIEATSLRALEKLERVLPSRVRHRLLGMREAVVTVPRNDTGQVPSTRLADLAAVCRRHERLRFDYQHHDGTTSTRHVEPHRLVYTGRRWYLVAWDLQREDWRSFRVDRLDPRPNTGPRFEPRDLDDESVASLTRWGVTTGAYRYRGRVTLGAPAPSVAERVNLAAAIVEPIDEGSCTLIAGANSLDELALYIGLIGVPFEVHEPPELTDVLGVLADRFRDACAPVTPAWRGRRSPGAGGR